MIIKYVFFADIFIFFKVYIFKVENNTGSIIFLNRGISNTYKKLSNNGEVYFKLLSQIYLPRDKAKREKALKLIDILLKSVSFYEIKRKES